MRFFAPSRFACAAACACLLAICLGCGWSTPQSRHNTQTGVSESGYPGGSATDPGSPALEAQRREEKKGIADNAPKGEAGGPGAKTAETHTPGQRKPENKK
ncbi:MAG: hypothetical protein M3Z09_04195 [Acidobacteriota bacterium]|nr:hypothetical protein [Acidobacteriota bacterium]